MPETQMTVNLKGKINQIFIFRLIAKVSRVLSPAERKEGLKVFFIIVLSAVIEMVSLFALFLFTFVAISPQKIFESPKLNWAYSLFNFSSPDQFMLMLVIGVFVIFFIKNVILLFILYLQSKYSYDVATSISERQFRKIYGRGLEYFSETNSAIVINNILNVPGIFATGTLLPLIYFFSELILLFFVLTSIFIASPMLFLSLLVVTLPVMGGIYWITKNKLQMMGREKSVLFTETLDKLNQAIFGYTDVILGNKEKEFMDSYLNDQRKLNSIHTLSYVMGFLPMRSLEFVSILGIVVIFIYAQNFGGTDNSLMEFMAMFAFSALRVIPSMNRTINAIMQMQTAESNFDLFLDGEPISLEKNIHPEVSFQEKIEIRDLTFSYRNSPAPVLNSLNFVIKKGQRIGIVGKSGSGKSTLVKVLLRFLMEQKGGIYLDGQKLTDELTRGWRDKIGYVQQDVFIVDGSLKQNIAFGESENEIDLNRLNAAIEQASLQDLVKQVPGGLDAKIGERGSMISGGQRQRIGIARALYKNAIFFVFDEATSALDSKTEQEITEAIDKLVNRERTILIIAHRITTLKGCDRIFEMQDGNIISEHKYADLIRNAN